MQTADRVEVRNQVSDQDHRFSVRYRFADWPNREIPEIAAGVYAVWDESLLVYCGMSGRGIEQAVAGGRQRYGLVTRLDSHASGRLSGDQFCVYVANRLVMPQLRSEELPRFGTGELNLDRLTRAYIHERFEYQFAVVGSSAEAHALERECQRGQVFGVRPPLNPL